MTIKICKPSNKGSKAANKVSVPSTTRTTRLYKSLDSSLIVIPDNYKPVGTKTTVSANLVRYRR